MRRCKTVIVLLMIAPFYTGCISTPRFTAAKEQHEEVTGTDGAVEEGFASYYAEEFNGRKTSNGEIYDMMKFTAAHRTLPFNTKVKVTNLQTGKSIVVRINDRGPFKEDRIIDLSLAAAKTLEVVGHGTAKVRLEVLETGDNATVKKP